MSSEEEFVRLQEELIRTAVAPDPEKVIQFLRLVRELKIRDSESVARYGNRLLGNHASLLNEDELWSVREQVAIAALDINAFDMAFAIIQKVLKKFPKSIRARRLEGMFYEAKGDYTRAASVYKHVLESDPSAVAMTKRLVALEKTTGNVTGAISLLTEYLDVHQTDGEAWEELAELYVEAQMYKQAVYCYEELILQNPTSVQRHVKLADVLFTLGGSAHLKAARAHYAKAVEGSGGASIRALYGLVNVAAALGDKPSSAPAGSSASAAAAASELPKVAAAALLDMYKHRAPDKVPIVSGMLEKMGVAVSGSGSAAS